MSYRQPYSHKTRFKVIHSQTKLVKVPKTKTNFSLVNGSTSQFKLVRNSSKPEKTVSSSKPTVLRAKSIDKSSSATLAKSIGNKYKWIRTSLKKTESNRLVFIRLKSNCNDFKFSFKLDHRKVLSPNSRIIKRKTRASLSKCLIRIRGVKFQTHPNGKCIKRLGNKFFIRRNLFYLFIFSF